MILTRQTDREGLLGTGEKMCMQPLPLYGAHGLMEKMNLKQT